MSKFDSVIVEKKHCITYMCIWHKFLIVSPAKHPIPFSPIHSFLIQIYRFYLYLALASQLMPISNEHAYTIRVRKLCEPLCYLGHGCADFRILLCCCHSVQTVLALIAIKMKKKKKNKRKYLSSSPQQQN